MFTFEIIIHVGVVLTFALLVLMRLLLDLRFGQVYEVPDSPVWKTAAGLWIGATFVAVGLHWVIVDGLFGMPPMAWGAAAWMLWTWSRMADAVLRYIKTRSTHRPKSNAHRA
ncbi:MAG: hypothetical protein AB7U20_00350 [Planctomycetaceae bacterium]